MFSNRRQAVHDRFDNARHQQHHGGGFHGQLENGFDVVACQYANGQSHHKPNRDRFAKRAKAFLHVVSAKMNTLQAWDFVDNRIDQNGDWAEVS
jgi:hypothetical protein